MTPMRNFVLVSVEKKGQEKSAGGIFIPTTVEDGVVSAKVLAVGSGYLNESGTISPLEVKVGDQVFFNKSFIVEIKHNQEVFQLVREENILAKL